MCLIFSWKTWIIDNKDYGFGYCLTNFLSSDIFMNNMINRYIPSFGFTISCGLSLVLPDLRSV